MGGGGGGVLMYNTGLNEDDGIGLPESINFLTKLKQSTAKAASNASIKLIDILHSNR